jgi:4-amino-4-deoxy-L-arabinose transferase-like glycosyltransferase
LNNPANIVRPRGWITWLLPLAAVALGVWRWFLPERLRADVSTPHALLDGLFAILWVALVLGIAWSLGQRITRRVNRRGFSPEQLGLMTLLLGLGLIGYGVMLLGVLQVWRSWVLWLLLPTLAWIGRQEGADIWPRMGMAWQGTRRGWRQLTLTEKLLALLAILLLLLAFGQALAPPWDYAALADHLEGGRRALAAGGLRLLPDLWQANGANLPDMLYLWGLAWGSDTAARLLNLVMGVLLVAAVYFCGRDELGPNVGRLATILLLGVPAFGLWATWAAADLFPALLEFLALWTGLKWVVDRRPHRLLWAGALLGLAVGSSYPALGTAALFLVGIGLASLGDGWRPWAARWGRFGIPLLLVGLPFYLKNLILAGNPIYPFGWGGPGWDAERLGLLLAFFQSFGFGRRPADFLALPFRLFGNHSQFAGLTAQVEIPNPLFWVVAAYPFLRRTRFLDGLALYGVARFGMWALGSQQMYLLLPLFPLASLLAAYVLLDLSARLAAFRLSSLPRLLPLGLAGVVMTASLFYASLNFLRVWPLPVAVGLESKLQFLNRVVPAYPAWEAVDELPPSAQVLQMWDGQGYYCGTRCIPDSERSRWTYWIGNRTNPVKVAERLQSLGVTHILYSRTQADYVDLHDRSGRNARARRYYEDVFRPACTQPIYADGTFQLDEITCLGAAAP